MNDNQFTPINSGDSYVFTIPEFYELPALRLSMGKIRDGEGRLVEAKVVNGGTYSELEFVFNEGYREAKFNLSVVGYEIEKTKKIIRQVKSEALLDEYSDYIKERKIKDSAAIREAFLETKDKYKEAVDRISLLNAAYTLNEGKIKVFENVCRYMRKEMDIQIRSGMINSNKTI